MSRPSELRAWVENQRAVERRIRLEALDKDRDTVRDAFDVVDIAAAVLGWPFPDDPVRERDVETVRRSWETIRRRSAIERVRAR